MSQKQQCNFDPLLHSLCPFSYSVKIVIEQPGILTSLRSLSAQDPSQPKIPVSPRSQSTQDLSQPKIQVSPGCPHVYYLVHAYLVFGSCLFDIWLNFQAYITYLLGKHLEVKLREKICQLSKFSRKFL